ncbi:MAG: pre-peptidase C-terminal domain-containing protein, partial [Anaerolineae bacterium]|nr:pre-peptidase C-terminal domain-containing protein [Anaerolineae bacterium]
MNRNLRLIPLLLLLSVVLLLAQNFVLAQDVPTTLAPDSPVTGELSAENVVDVYRIQAEANSTITVTVTSDALPVAMVLTDAQGIAFAEVVADEAGVAALENFTVQTSGLYFVTVFAAPGANPAVGSYEIALTLPASAEETTAESTEVAEVPATTAPETTQQVVATLQPPTDILLNSGMEVRLSWNAAVDLNLEVRDPLGNTLYFDSRTSATGGEFGFDVNGLCEVLTENPVETATWPAGFLPTGSYEILVFYRQDCEGISQSVEFTLDVTVDGQALDSVTATLPPRPAADVDSVYLANYVVRADGSATINTGGYYPDTAINQLPAAFAELSSNATPIEQNVPVTGAIFEEQDYLAYRFDAAADDVVTIQMTATSGSLDTLLQLIDPNGNVVQINDDFTGTDSTIANARLLQAGTYTIVATRYGKELGGTEGEFQLTLSGSTDALPSNLANLNLPDGDIEVYLTWETNADLQLLVRDPAGQAIFDDEPRSTSGGLLAANGNVGCQVSGGTAVSYIY